MGYFDVNSVSIAAIATGVSVIGSMGGIITTWRVTEAMERYVTGVKVLCILVILGLFMYLLSYLDGYSVSDLIPEFLVGGTVFVMLILSLAWVKGEEVVGVGSPLMWVTLRILLSPNVSFFWAWCIFCVLAFLAINAFRKRSHEKNMVVLHWFNWQSLACANSLLLLNVGVALALLISNGRSVQSCVALEDTAESYIGLSQQLALYRPNLTEASLWSQLGYENFEANVVTSLQSNVCTSHYMYENNAAILAVVLLLINLAWYVVGSLRDQRTKQGNWLPIFFLAVGVVILMYPRSPDDSLGFLTKRLTNNWHNDAIMAFCLGLFGGILGIVITAYRIRGSEIERDNTPHRRMTAKHDSAFAALGIGLCALVCASAAIGIAIEPAGTQYLNTTEPLMALSSFENSSFIVDLAVSSFSEIELKILFAETNCTTVQCAIKGKTLMADNTLTDLSDTSTKLAYQALSVPWVIWNVAVSVTALMQWEMVAIAVIEVITLVCTVGAVRYRALDDGLVVGNLLSATIFILAVFQRIQEFWSLVPGSAVEWQFVLLGILQLLGCLAVIGLRIESPDNVDRAWISQNDLDIALFQSGRDDVRGWILEETGLDIGEVRDPGKTFEAYDRAFIKEYGPKGDRPRLSREPIAV